ncbi:MAG: hypothetical protein R3E31_17395 [Chloroflexota bacterium]
MTRNIFIIGRHIGLGTGIVAVGRHARFEFGRRAANPFPDATGLPGTDILRQKRQRSSVSVRSGWKLLQDGWQRRRQQTAVSLTTGTNVAVMPATVSLASIPITGAISSAQPESCATGCCGESDNNCSRERPFRQRLLQETWSATRLVVQFMALAFCSALIVLFVPEAWIAGLLGTQNRWAVPLAAILGVPVYTSNLTALPLIEAYWPKE